MSEMESRRTDSMTAPEPSAAPARAQGSVCAALVSAGLGCGALGCVDVLAAASPAANRAFNIYNPSGALSGETTLAVVLWLLTWLALDRRWTKQPPRLAFALGTAFALLLLGLALTFRPSSIGSAGTENGLTSEGDAR